MKTTTKLSILCMAIVSVSLASCGGDDRKTSFTSTPIDTARALSTAKVALDDREPEEANDNNISFNDVSDTADPIETNGT